MGHSDWFFCCQDALCCWRAEITAISCRADSFFFYFFVLLVFFIGQVGDSLYPRVDPPGQS